MRNPAGGKTILIHFAGPDHRGILAEIMGTFAGMQATILDLGQAVVHETLALGILCEVENVGLLPELRKEIRLRARALGLQVRFTAVPHGRLQHWIHGLHASSFIITVLGRSLSAGHLARVSAILAAHEMRITRMDRLSGPLRPEAGQTGACVEFTASGDPAREQAMRADFLAAAQELAIDVACQREGIFRRNRRLFVFDMDSTLIQGEVIDELARMAGVGSEVAGITEAAMRGELNFDESFTRRVGLLKGLDAERALSLRRTIPLAEGAERLIRILKRLGYKTAILSGGFTFFADDLQQRLGIDFVHANTLETADGVVTGRVVPPIMNGARKAQMLAEIAAREGVLLEQVVAVGDGANDILMLNLAGMGIAYRAKPLVRERADQSISCLGLDGLLYLLGVRDRDLDMDMEVEVDAADKPAK
ncbi:MAG TPA: phosphoserine phosphatase SerB [Terracidiphilus sp.]|nr:phosphoserine phosphatase SerB [Terracidiphilus sp.]